MIVYTVRLASEYATQGHLRIPGLRKDPNHAGGAHYKTLMRAALESRTNHETESLEILDSDCFIVSDAGNIGNHAALLGVFHDSEGAALPKHVKKLQVFFDEEDPIRCFTKIFEICPCQFLFVTSAYCVLLTTQ